MRLGAAPTITSTSSHSLPPRPGRQNQFPSQLLSGAGLVCWCTTPPTHLPCLIVRTTNCPAGPRSTADLVVAAGRLGCCLHLSAQTGCSAAGGRGESVWPGRRLQQHGRAGQHQQTRQGTPAIHPTAHTLTLLSRPSSYSRVSSVQTLCPYKDSKIGGVMLKGPHRSTVTMSSSASSLTSRTTARKS